MITIKNTELFKNIEFLNNGLLIKGSIIENDKGEFIRSNGNITNEDGDTQYGTFYIEEGVSLSIKDTVGVELLPKISEIFTAYYTELLNT